MGIPAEALELENRSIGGNGEATLADAYAILRDKWLSGDRDRELGLHLLFLAWYGATEPDHITGFRNPWQENRTMLLPVFKEVHDYIEPTIGDDAEMLYVVGLIAHMDWIMLDDDLEIARIWERRAEEYRKRYRRLAPNGIDPMIFENRGAYGDYFAGHARLENAY